MPQDLSENEKEDNPKPGCGCLGAFLGGIICSGVGVAVATRVEHHDGDTASLSGAFDGLLGAAIGAIIGVAFAALVTAPLQGLQRKRGGRTLASLILFIVGILAAGLIEMAAERIAITAQPVVPSSTGVGPGATTWPANFETGPVAYPPVNRAPARRMRRGPRVLNPALEPGDE